MLFIEDKGQVLIELGNWIDFQGSILYIPMLIPNYWHMYILIANTTPQIYCRSLCHTNSIQYHEQTTSTPHATL